MRTSLKGYVQNMLDSEDENGGCKMSIDYEAVDEVMFDKLQRENAELRKQLEEREEFIKRWVGEETEWQETNGQEWMERAQKAEQQLAEANASVAQLRAALKFYADRDNYLGDIEIMTAKNDVSCIAQQALSTTPSQAAKRQKRLIEAAKAIYAKRGGRWRDGAGIEFHAIDAELIDKLAAAIKEAE